MAEVEREAGQVGADALPRPGTFPGVPAWGHCVGRLLIAKANPMHKVRAAPRMAQRYRLARSVASPLVPDLIESNDRAARVVLPVCVEHAPGRRADLHGTEAVHNPVFCPLLSSP